MISLSDRFEHSLILVIDGNLLSSFVKLQSLILIILTGVLGAIPFLLMSRRLNVMKHVIHFLGKRVTKQEI